MPKPLQSRKPILFTKARPHQVKTKVLPRKAKPRHKGELDSPTNLDEKLVRAWLRQKIRPVCFASFTSCFAKERFAMDQLDGRKIKARFIEQVQEQVSVQRTDGRTFKIH